MTLSATVPAFLRRLGLFTILVSGLAITTPAVFAQASPDNPNRQERRENRNQDANGAGRLVQVITEATRELNLSDDQKRELQQIFRETRDKLRDSRDMSRQDRRNLIRDTFEELQQDVAAVLTPEQKQTFDAKIAELRDRVQNADRDEPSTQPTTAPSAVAQVRGAGALARLTDAIEAADLTDAQKAQVHPILTDAAVKIREVLASARANGGTPDREAIREKVQPIVDETRSNIIALLTPEQREKVRSAMQADGNRRQDGDRPRRDEQRDTPPANKPTDKPADPLTGMTPTMDSPGMMGMPDMTMTPATQEAGETGLLASDDKPSADTQVLQVGDAMPTFTLNRLNGRAVSNQSLAGKPTVILFGSHTAASFRDRAPQLTALAKRVGTSRVNWLVIYTREMHPSDADNVPERNLKDKIHIDEHKTLDARIAAAKQARAALELTLDIAPDTIDNATADAFGGFPNAAFVFDAKGVLVAQQRWADPFAIRRALDKTLKR